MGAYPDCDKCPSIWDLYWYIFVIVIVTTYVLWRMSRYRKKWQAAKAIMMADMGGDNLVLFKDAVKGKGDMPYMPTNDDNMMMSNNPMFEIEADNLARKQALLQEELDKEKLNGAAATIEALQAEREAMRKKMQDLMKKNQHLEDNNEKKGRKKVVPKGKKTQFGQQGVGLD